MSDTILTRVIDGRRIELRSEGWARYSDHDVRIYDVTDGREALINDGVDAMPHDGDLKKVPTALLRSLLSPRKRALIGLMADNRIVSGTDYGYEDEYEALYGTNRQPGRYVAVSRDETYTFMHICGSLRDALRSLASEVEQVDTEYPHNPVGVYDLDQRVMLGVEITAVAKVLR